MVLTSPLSYPAMDVPHQIAIPEELQTFLDDNGLSDLDRASILAKAVDHLVSLGTHRFSELIGHYNGLSPLYDVIPQEGTTLLRGHIKVEEAWIAQELSEIEDMATLANQYQTELDTLSQTLTQQQIQEAMTPISEPESPTWP